MQQNQQAPIFGTHRSSQEGNHPAILALITIHFSNITDGRRTSVFLRLNRSKPSPIHRYHPFGERLIGTIRREFPDQTLFWNAVDLERKLEAFKDYYNHNRFHASLGGDTPAQVSGKSKIRQANLESYRWEPQCRGLVQLPMAA